MGSISRASITPRRRPRNKAPASVRRRAKAPRDRRRGARSSTPCMVAPTRPISTTGQASLMKRASEVPPLVESCGRRPVTSSTALATRSVKAPRGGEERDGVGGIEAQACTRAPPAAAATRRSISAAQRFGRPQIVEADVEDEAHLAGNDVGRGIADVDADDFEIGGLEVGRAGIERRRLQRGRGSAPARGSDCRRDGDRRRGPACRRCVSRPVSEPRRPFLIVSPSAATLVGSPSRQ